jgi:peptidoglycan L-alanyl-D-glutamate endopeptidase CwlK
MDKLQRNSDLNLLHPLFRETILKVIDQLNLENLPFEIFEAYRWPERQAELFNQGRTTPGSIVTYATAWKSYHQYGLAVDLVLKINGKWSWDNSGKLKIMWDRMHSIGLENGLQFLKFETPHLQIGNTSTEALFHGNYPDGGDQTWSENLKSAILSWHGEVPPMPS